MGKLAGGFIDVYLLEKSRVTYQQPNERGYHIFFQLVEEGPVPGLQEMILMSTDPYDYFFCSQGKVKVDSIDDQEVEGVLLNTLFAISISNIRSWSSLIRLSILSASARLRSRTPSS